jgi:hypothetical protein
VTHFFKKDTELHRPANCREHSSWDTNSCSAGKEITSFLQNPKVHYGIHKSLPLGPVFSQLNSVHTLFIYDPFYLLPSGLYACRMSCSLAEQEILLHAPCSLHLKPDQDAVGSPQFVPLNGDCVFPVAVHPDRVATVIALLQQPVI